MPLEPRHGDVVPHLRRADVEEIIASCGLSPRLAVAFSMATADPGWAVELEGRTLAVFGASPAGGGVGRPWLVGTDELEDYPVAFFRVSREIVEDMSAKYDLLENWTDARNTLSLRWLEWVGFTLEPPEAFGPQGRLFHRFWR